MKTYSMQGNDVYSPSVIQNNYSGVYVLMVKMWSMWMFKQFLS